MVLLSDWAVLLWLNGLLSPLPVAYASPLILHQFSPAKYVVRALLVANAAQLNGPPLFAVVLVCLLIFSFHFLVYFLLPVVKELRKIFFVHKKCGIPGLHVLVPLSHRSSGYTMIYFQFFCLFLYC